MSSRSQNRETLKIVIAGHVDHGKSTLIGRLLYETDSLPNGKKEEIEKISKSRNLKDVEWSFVLDAFQAERDQAVTIDSTQVRFRSAKRDYVIIDAPGHREFLKNMISGASAADAAVLVVDAAEGVQEQSRRHVCMLSLLGLDQIGVVINKMDIAGHDVRRFEELKGQAEECLASFGLGASWILPLSARSGEMIAVRGANMNWYDGETLLGALDMFSPAKGADHLPLRFPVQDVYRLGDKRIIVGRIESGGLRKGDVLVISPSNEKACVTSLEVWPAQEDKIEVQAGESIGITLDKPVFVERGALLSHEEDAPMLSNTFRARIFWLSDKPLKVGNSYSLRFGTSQTKANVQSIERLVDTENLSHDGETGDVLRHMVGEITMRARDMLPLEINMNGSAMERVVFYDGDDIVGGGMMSGEGHPDQRYASRPKSENIFVVDHLMSAQKRAEKNGHAGGVFWFTGLSGAGKSTLAMTVEKALFEKGYKTYVLDGDNIRYGLNSDLGFSPEDRAENIRRVGEVAALMADAGLIVISAFISPYRDDRDRARAACKGGFHEIFVKADLGTCEGRDPKGLYKKARAGEIKDFTGVGSPYEEPENPEIIIDTQNNDISTCVNQVMRYIEDEVILKNADGKETFVGL